MFPGLLLLMMLHLQSGQLQERLLIASRYGDLSFVSALLASGVTPDVRHNLTGWTPLMVAAYYGHVSVVEGLLAAGADSNAVDLRGGTALMKAVALPGGEDSSLISNKAKIVKALLGAGADPQKKDRLGGTAWQSALLLEQDELVAVFADAGVPGVRESLILLAVAKQDRNRIETLLAAGVDINYRDESGMTILGESVLSGNAAIVAMILKQGADVNGRIDAGWTPLMLAASRNDAEVLRMLLSAGADRKVLSDSGQTALDLSPPDSDCREILSQSSQSSQ